MIVILNTDYLERLDIDFLNYAILKMIFASETKKQACFISQEKMSQYLGITRQTLSKRLKDLEKKGYLYKSFQYKRVSPKVRDIFEKESYYHALKQIKTRRKKKYNLKKNSGDLLALFDAVYGKIKKGGEEN